MNGQQNGGGQEMTCLEKWTDRNMENLAGHIKTTDLGASG